jgi:hypothetical protein
MANKMLTKFKEAAQAGLPVSIIIIILNFTVCPMPFWDLISFAVGAFLLILGMSLFTLGADLAMMPIGEAIGAELPKSKKLWFVIIGCIVLGVVVTIAEPDLQLLTQQVPAIPDAVMIGAVAFGVGAFLALAMLRILFQISLTLLLIISYIAVFVIALLLAPDFLALGFDAGGVTTGPITVPFILALGAGIAAIKGGKNEETDSFGLCALCSIGPIIAVLILGVFFDPEASGYAFKADKDIASVSGLISLYAYTFGHFFQKISAVLLPILIIFVLFQIIRLRLPKRKLIRIIIGLIYTLFGLTIFLTGVNVGFMSAGIFIAESLVSGSYQWLLLPIAAIIGFFIIFAEPTVHVLNKQVEDITSGAISKRILLLALAFGVCLAMILSTIRILTETSIWFFLLPGYAAALILAFFTPKLFTAIAFDSGGVASGTMSVAFALPFAIGICQATGGNVMIDGFGIIAMVALMPIITVQIIGIIYEKQQERNRTLELVQSASYPDENEDCLEMTEFIIPVEKSLLIIEEAKLPVKMPTEQKED